MANFWEVLSDCNLFDLGFQGVPWTYSNKRDGNKNVKVRLDRAVACPRWSSLFPHCKVSHVISSRSYHCPLLIQLLGSPRASTFKKHLRYESYWEREGMAFDDQIKYCWDNRSHVGDLGD